MNKKQIFFDITIAETIGFEENIQIDHQEKILQFIHLYGNRKLGLEM